MKGYEWVFFLSTKDRWLELGILQILLLKLQLLGESINPKLMMSSEIFFFEMASLFLLTIKAAHVLFKK